MKQFPWTTCLVPLYCVKKGGSFSFDSNLDRPFVKDFYIKFNHSWKCHRGVFPMFVKSSDLVFARYDQLKHSSHE